jgi:basic membrane protein A and related proteins
MRKSYLMFYAVAVFVFILVPSTWAQMQAAPKIKFAAILPGTVQDGEYNWLASVVMKELTQTGACETTYSEKVAVPDAARVMREYIAIGNKIIWAHGAQLNNAVHSIADANPDVTFIVETEPKPPADTMKANIWYIDRNRHTGFYPLGKLASLVTKTKKVGYIGGVPLPFIWGNIHAAKQALKDTGKEISFDYIHCGDFNDPVKGKQAAEALIGKGCDIILSELSLGNTGVFQAIREAKVPIFVAVNMTSRKDQLPERYLTSDMYEFSKPVAQVVDQVKLGKKGGYLLMEYGHPGKPRHLEVPVMNVDEGIRKELRQTVDDIISGKIKVVLDQTRE